MTRYVIILNAPTRPLPIVLFLWLYDTGGTIGYHLPIVVQPCHTIRYLIVSSNIDLTRLLHYNLMIETTLCEPHGPNLQTQSIVRTIVPEDEYLQSYVSMNSGVSDSGAPDRDAATGGYVPMGGASANVPQENIYDTIPESVHDTVPDYAYYTVPEENIYDTISDNEEHVSDDDEDPIYDDPNVLRRRRPRPR